MNTIFAQCSAHGKAGVAVFRVSGPKTINVINQLITKNAENLIPRKFYFLKIYNPLNKQQIDESMVVIFRDGFSFTGEDSARNTYSW